MKKSEARPNSENSQFKLWIAHKNGQNQNVFSFPKEERRLKFSEAQIFAKMYDRMLVKRNLIGKIRCAMFYNNGNLVYVVDQTGKVRRAKEKDNNSNLKAK